MSLSHELGLPRRVHDIDVACPSKGMSPSKPTIQNLEILVEH